MDRITKSLLNEFSREHEFEALEEYKRFEHFVCSIVLRREHSESFDSDDVVFGSGSDTGIDGIGIIVNGFLVRDSDELEEVAGGADYLDVTFIFVQAETSSSFEASKIGTFGFGVLDFFKEEHKLPRTKEIDDAAGVVQEIYDQSRKFKKGRPKCKLFYATTGKWTGDANLKARLESVREDLKNTDTFEDVEFWMFGAAELQNGYYKSKNAVSAEFTFTTKITVPDVPNVSEAYIGLLPWGEFRKLITDENGMLLKQLFFDNLRDWQGLNKVNDEIGQTLRSPDRARFALMNNGVTVIAGVVQTTGNRVTIEDYQIVNGCQTSHVLFYERESLDDKGLNIPLRLIGTTDEDVKKSIIKATNRQTEIKEHLFFALEEFPKKLEAHFGAYPLPQRLYFERRTRQYEHLEIEKTRVIGFDVMLKAFAAMFLNEPHRTTRNYKAIKDRLGKDVFARDHQLEPYYAAAAAYYRVDFMFRNRRLDSRYKVTRFHILMLVRILLAGFEMPKRTARKVNDYCHKIVDGLDTDGGEAVIRQAVRVIDSIAPGEVPGEFDRDQVRTEAFTSAVIAKGKKVKKRR